MTAPAELPPFDDVRMRGFRTRTSVDDVLRLIESRLAPLSAEPIPILAAAGRVLAEPVVAAADVPGFVRAAMDGFAVRAFDTTQLEPLTIIGESLPARPFTGGVGPGQAVRIMTGAPLPTGVDAVLRAEVADEQRDGRVVVREAVEPGRNVGRVGEDVAKCQIVLPAGRLLRPQDVGLIAAVGVGTVAVVRQPRIAILATGDELLPPGSVPVGFHIVDSNSPMLAAVVVRDGGIGLPVRTLPDRYETIRDALRETDADLILVSGGSSVGKEDHTPRAVAELGELAVHGVAIRPAGPLGIGFIPRPVVLLPGNPVSCLCGYDLFAGRAIRRLGGRPSQLPYRCDAYTLASAIHSVVGRTDYVRVTVLEGVAHPLTAGGASVLSSTVNADGFLLIPPARERMEAGESVVVWLYD